MLVCHNFNLEEQISLNSALPYIDGMGESSYIVRCCHLTGFNSTYIFFIVPSGTFNPPGSVLSVKTSQSFSTKKSSSDAPPPVPPPFPKDVLETGKERVIFL